MDTHGMVALVGATGELPLAEWLGIMDLVLGEIDLATVKLHTLSVRGRCCWTGWYTSATGYSSLRWTHTVRYGARVPPLW